MNLPEFLDLRKDSGRSTFLCFVIVLVAVASFFLGRLSGVQGGVASSQTGAVLVGADDAGPSALSLHGEETAALQSASEAVAGGVVASKSGAKYHFPWCAGAKSIKESNKIWFSTPAEAQAAGYTPASNCKGLE